MTEPDDSTSAADLAFAALLALDEAVVVLSASGEVRLWNRAAERTYGYPEAEVLGRPVSFLDPTGTVFLEDALEAVRRGERVGPAPVRRIHRSGQVLRLSLTLTPLRGPGGSILGAVEIARDSRDADRFRLAVESAPNAMITVDAWGRIVMMNQYAERTFGYSRDELLGQSIELLVPERYRADHPALRDGFLANPGARPMGAGRDLYGLRKDGTEVPVEIGLNPIRTEEGLFVLASVVDITERKRAQLALAQKNEEVEAFVYIVSHDLRTPLVNLQGFSRELGLSCDRLRDVLAGVELPETVAREVGEILGDEVPSALRFILASTNKFERLINALLGLSRSGRQVLRFEPLDMEDVVRTTLDSLQKTIQQTGAEIEAGPLPPAFGDLTAVGQVFANLVTNALLYLDPARPGRIGIEGKAAAGMNRYSVTDNGRGIPASARSRLFQVFQRFHPDVPTGEGMGLAIIKRVVERHGGRVWVESEEGVGAAFHFTLPRVPDTRKESRS